MGQQQPARPARHVAHIECRPPGVPGGPHPGPRRRRPCCARRGHCAPAQLPPGASSPCNGR
eukprot:2629590-Lingulodinium_polyedra.AAC.1